MGVEPTTTCLQGRCTTVVLPQHKLTEATIYFDIYRADNIHQPKHRIRELVAVF